MKRLLVFILILVLIPAFVFSGSNNSNTSAEKLKVKKGTDQISVTGRSRHWDDMEKISLLGLSKTRKMKPVMNFKNPRTLVKKSTTLDPHGSDPIPRP